MATLRPEFFAQLLASPELAGLAVRPFPLRPLRRDALPMVIEEPARLAGIGIDTELVARLVADTETGEALPLLAFTLEQLAAGVARGGQLSQARYEALGGVRGALIRQADGALADTLAAGGRTTEQVIGGLLRLVTVDEQGRLTRWRVARQELPEPVRAELDAFVARRLLGTDTEDGTVVLEVAHEACLSAWPPLATAITGPLRHCGHARTVEQAAEAWDAPDVPTRGCGNAASLPPRSTTWAPACNRPPASRPDRRPRAVPAAAPILRLGARPGPGARHRHNRTHPASPDVPPDQHPRRPAPPGPCQHHPVGAAGTRRHGRRDRLEPATRRPRAAADRDRPPTDRAGPRRPRQPRLAEGQIRIDFDNAASSPPKPFPGRCATSRTHGGMARDSADTAAA